MMWRISLRMIWWCTDLKIWKWLTSSQIIEFSNCQITFTAWTFLHWHRLLQTRRWRHVRCGFRSPYGMNSSCWWKNFARGPCVACWLKKGTAWSLLIAGWEGKQSEKNFSSYYDHMEKKHSGVHCWNNGCSFEDITMYFSRTWTLIIAGGAVARRRIIYFRLSHATY